MVIVGAVLLVLCLLLGAGIALSNTETTSAEAFGVSLSNVTLGALFGVGVAVGALAMLGLGLMLAGGARKRAKKVALKREVKHVRNEQETLAEENARLQEQLEHERTTGTAPYDATVAGPPAGEAAAPEPTSRGRHGA